MLILKSSISTLAQQTNADNALQKDQEARRKAQRLHFQLVHDPVDLFARLVKLDRKAAR